MVESATSDKETTDKFISLSSSGLTFTAENFSWSTQIYIRVYWLDSACATGLVPIVIPITISVCDLPAFLPLPQGSINKPIAQFESYTGATTTNIAMISASSIWPAFSYSCNLVAPLHYTLVDRRGTIFTGLPTYSVDSSGNVLVPTDKSGVTTIYVKLGYLAAT